METSRTGSRPGPLAWILLLPVHLYRKVIAPLLPPLCRFYPSCSAYAVESLTVHGAFKGGALTVWRLLRCGPWHPGGLDPVPPRGQARRAFARRAARPVEPDHTDEHTAPDRGAQ